MELDEGDKYEPMLDELVLDVKPKIYTGPSLKTSSFLDRAEKLKKVRGMDSDIQKEEY